MEIQVVYNTSFTQMYYVLYVIHFLQESYIKYVGVDEYAIERQRIIRIIRNIRNTSIKQLSWKLT